MKAWRKQKSNGRGKNRREKERDSQFRLPIGMPALLRALFKRAGIESV